MHIPRAWAKASADGQTADGRTLPVSVWGWGEDEAGARKGAADRLQRLLERIRRGDPFPDKYSYGSRPLREEILGTIEGEVPGEPLALITRNSYGAQVLTASRLLFLDVDLNPPTFLQRVLRMFGAGRDSSEETVLARLRSVLQQYGKATFRIYRTASGLRAMAIDREFDPAGSDAQELMKATGTDPAFSRLCLAQRSFRARLTPKPWRCKISNPPSEYPRPEGEARRRFATWLKEYEDRSRGYATCRYLETIGNASPRGGAGKLLELHDRVARCSEPLPLA
jgi:hypothetical protein